MLASNAAGTVSLRECCWENNQEGRGRMVWGQVCTLQTFVPPFWINVFWSMPLTSCIWIWPGVWIGPWRAKCFSAAASLTASVMVSSLNFFHLKRFDIWCITVLILSAFRLHWRRIQGKLSVWTVWFQTERRCNLPKTSCRESSPVPYPPRVSPCPKQLYPAPAAPEGWTFTLVSPSRWPKLAVVPRSVFVPSNPIQLSELALWGDGLVPCRGETGWNI